jgi:hypothetical protein
MIPNRRSIAVSTNEEFVSRARPRGQGNVKWLTEAVGGNDPQGMLLLFGAVTRTAWRLRFAQSQMRHDLVPSYWSHVALIESGGARDWRLLEISLEPQRGFGDVPRENAVQRGVLSAYDDPDVVPNIAYLTFLPKAQGKEKPGASFDEAVEATKHQRQLADLTSGLLDWLGYAWGVGTRTNPLLTGSGMPSAVFAQTVYAIMGIELTPGLATTSACPEAIWQTAKWWHPFYASTASRAEGVLRGRYCIGHEIQINEPGSRRSASRRR